MLLSLVLQGGVCVTVVLPLQILHRHVLDCMIRTCSFLFWLTQLLWYSLLHSVQVIPVVSDLICFQTALALPML